MNQTYQQINQYLVEWVEDCRKEFSDNLLAIVHFGSTTHGYIKQETDIDLCLVFKVLPNDRRKQFEYLANAEKKLEKKLQTLTNFNLLISTLPKTEQAFRKFHPLYLDWVDHSNILYDPEKIATEVIQKTADWIRQSGAYKVQKGSLWYWILKPDYTPGEIFEVGYPS